MKNKTAITSFRYRFPAPDCQPKSSGGTAEYAVNGPDFFSIDQRFFFNYFFVGFASLIVSVMLYYKKILAKNYAWVYDTPIIDEGRVSHLKRFIGDRLKELRIKAGFETQKNLADKIGAYTQQVSNWESGKGTPGTPWLLRLSDALGCRIDDLFDGKDEKAA